MARSAPGLLLWWVVLDCSTKERLLNRRYFLGWSFHGLDLPRSSLERLTKMCPFGRASGKYSGPLQSPSKWPVWSGPYSPSSYSGSLSIIPCANSSYMIMCKIIWLCAICHDIHVGNLPAKQSSQSISSVVLTRFFSTFMDILGFVTICYREAGYGVAVKRTSTPLVSQEVSLQHYVLLNI